MLSHHTYALLADFFIECALSEADTGSSPKGLGARLRVNASFLTATLPIGACAHKAQICLGRPGGQGVEEACCSGRVNLDGTAPRDEIRVSCGLTSNLPCPSR